MFSLNRSSQVECTYHPIGPSRAGIYRKQEFGGSKVGICGHQLPHVREKPFRPKVRPSACFDNHLPVYQERCSNHIRFLTSQSVGATPLYWIAFTYLEHCLSCCWILSCRRKANFACESSSWIEPLFCFLIAPPERKWQVPQTFPDDSPTSKRKFPVFVHLRNLEAMNSRRQTDRRIWMIQINLWCIPLTHLVWKIEKLVCFYDRITKKRCWFGRMCVCRCMGWLLPRATREAVFWFPTGTTRPLEGSCFELRSTQRYCTYDKPRRAQVGHSINLSLVERCPAVRETQAPKKGKKAAVSLGFRTKLRQSGPTNSLTWT